jgi:RNA polymerase sigma factor (sigma-70 family)
MMFRQPVDTDTHIGGSADRFPETHRTGILRAGCADAALRRVAHEQIAAAYWKPVYKYIRWQWRESNEAAKDLTQGFFAMTLDRDVFAAWDPERAAFRTFLRMCVDRYVGNQRVFAGRQKRAASATESLDEDTAMASFDADEYLHREWIRQVFSMSVASLRAEYNARGRGAALRAFEMYDLAEEARPTYSEIAAALAVSVTQVTNYLAAARRDLRRIVLDRLRELTATEREFRSEARAVLGIEV